MQYGYFNDAAREYVITHPKTPVKWINDVGALATDKGIKLSWPGYNGFDPQKGGVTTYPPGAKENGGIFLHPNPWGTMADEHPDFGLGRNSWLSGTASWMYRSSTRYVLGIHPEHEGLRFDPCIPKSWDGFIVERTCRGAAYRITLGNPEGKSKGVTALMVDGKPVRGNLIPWFGDGIHMVEARL